MSSEALLVTLMGWVGDWIITPINDLLSDQACPDCSLGPLTLLGFASLVPLFALLVLLAMLVCMSKGKSEVKDSDATATYEPIPETVETKVISGDSGSVTVVSKYDMRKRKAPKE